LARVQRYTWQPGTKRWTHWAGLGLSVFDAVQQQLGLKLVDSKATFDMVVIDHVERLPAAN
jgi:uncharacterized protein (TIGR03435 family)